MDRYQHEALRIQNENDFSAQALKTFRFQYANIPVYRKYVQLLNIHPQDIQKVEEIPFLPISAFKTHKVCPEGKKVDVTSTIQTDKIIINNLLPGSYSIIVHALDKNYQGRFIVIWK